LSLRPEPTAAHSVCALCVVAIMILLCEHTYQVMHKHEVCYMLYYPPYTVGKHAAHAYYAGSAQGTVARRECKSGISSVGKLATSEDPWSRYTSWGTRGGDPSQAPHTTGSLPCSKRPYRSLPCGCVYTLPCVVHGCCVAQDTAGDPLLCDNPMTARASMVR